MPTSIARLSLLVCALAALAPAQHWAFQVPARYDPPRVADPAWVRDPIDAFVLRRLEREGLKPSPAADRATLVRRLYLDLTGLPPTTEQLDRFLRDRSEDAYEQVVERILTTNPHVAEHLAVPWLDAARYADTNGFSIDDHRDMWAWRDWVISAIGRNMPYDRFLTLQLAGDLVPDATDATRLATGFLRNGANTHEGGTIPAEYRVIYIADKVDTVASTFMGLTMRCAQCHDHEYDPITQREYYGMYAFFDTAHEPGMGATNGNTKPVLLVDPPIGGTAMLRRRTEERLETLRRHRRQPAHLAASRSEWMAKESARLGARARTGATLTMPPRDAKSGERVRWIWTKSPEKDQKVRFERSVSIEGPVTSAALVFTCDNAAEVRVNGKVVGKLDDWLKPSVIDLAGSLRAGVNRVLVDAVNHDGPAGFVGFLQYEVGGKTHHVPTDASWRITALGGRPADIASHEVATYGGRPWNKILGATVEGAGLPDALGTPAAQRTGAMWDAINEAYARVEPRMRHHLQATGRELEIIERVRTKGRASVMVMAEKGPRTTFVLTRGEYDKPDRTRPVKPHGPAAVPGLPEGDRTRLDLARWLTAPQHPLTGRVAVNRVWQLLFGRGLVATPDDFGIRGARPSHPELLDTLARDFVDGGFDVRALIERIVLSSTYRQSSHASAELLRRDPDNELLARGARYRLSAEAIRDGALAISGLLLDEVGGPPVYPPQPFGLWREVSHFGYAPAFTAQAYFEDAPRTHRRRSLYAFWKRTSPPPTMTAFDAPNREVCTLQRSRTNTPLQALTTLNDPQFVQAALALAVGVGRLGPDEGVRQAFRRATGRWPDALEQRVLVSRLGTLVAHHRARPEEGADLVRAASSFGLELPEDVAAWATVCSIILNLDEVITRR